MDLPNSFDALRLRPELRWLSQQGYKFSDPFEVLELFEKKLATFCGAAYAVVVDSNTHALELALRWSGTFESLEIPKHTYLSVPQMVRKLGTKVAWTEEKWYGVYQVKPSSVIDASLRLKPNMYKSGTLMCLSFQHKKHLPIGRGGMILTDNEKAHHWLKRAVYDGRELQGPWKEMSEIQEGYHYQMIPEDAARGILLFDALTHPLDDLGGWSNYPDLTQWQFYQEINRGS